MYTYLNQNPFGRFPQLHGEDVLPAKQPLKRRAVGASFQSQQFLWAILSQSIW